MSRSGKYENVRHVYRLLKEKGDIDKIKSQIRSKLILGFGSLDNSKTKFDTETTDRNIRMANCLVADHLKIHGYDYSLSVFLPEIGLTNFELEEFIKDISHLRLYSCFEGRERLTSFYKESYSLLVSILKAYEDISSLSKEHKAIQTVEIDGSDLDHRLNNINKEYEAMKSLEILYAKQSFDDRLEQYKSEINERSQVEIEKQISEFRQNELNSLKSELEEEFQKRLLQNTQRLQEEFELRCQSLNEQEVLLREKYSLFQQKEEREAFVRRQALQAELDAIQLVKTQLDQEKIQIDNDKLQLHKDYEKNELEFKKRENLLEIREKTLESEIHEHVNQIRMEDEIKLMKQRKELELQSIQLSENQKMLEDKLKTIEQLKQELLKQQNKFTEMEIVGYDTIKTQNEVFKAEISNLQKQLKNSLTELEEQKQIAASATTELSVLKVVKQETEKLMNTLNNDHTVIIQEKFTLQKKLNEQKNEIYELMERLSSYEGGNKQNHAQTTEVSSVGHWSTVNQNLNNPQILTEAERRSIYEECNLSISSDLSHESLIDTKKSGKSFTVPIQLSTDSKFDHWSKRLELSRRRMTQLQLVNEEFDSIYEEWKSVDLKEFLSKIHSDLPSFLNAHELNQPIKLKEDNLSDQIVMINEDTKSDPVKEQPVNCNTSFSLKLDNDHNYNPVSTPPIHHNPLDQQVEMNPCHENEYLASYTKANSESKNVKIGFEQNNQNAQIHSSARIIPDFSASSSSIDTPKSKKLELKKSSNETLSISSHKPIKSSSTVTHHSFKKSSIDHLSSYRSKSVLSTESISQAESAESKTSRNSQTNSLANEMSNHTISCQFNKNDNENKSVCSEQDNNENEEQREFLNSNQANLNDEIANNNHNNDTIENGFPLLLETSRYEGSPKQCSLGNDDQNKPISNENTSPTSRHTITKQTDCNGLMEKYLKLSLNTSSKSPVSYTCNQAVNGTKITNGYHSPSSKEKPLWFENGHHFSSSESEIISLNNGKTRCHFTPGNFNKDELIPNDVDIDSGSDYIW
ncbi:oxidative DNA demethylase [Schistosoma haematobium]|uniref:Oxidative DNA demethylase n=1 Tax=Schistosoma haematobium TaxID=6185 RepID=A0A922S6K1_SCHHA|nr:oxidative DNA demethylase [Schistosoma haematobium]KAH9595473.1 oxidative DNA demethylase [Schistosoma haematobium]CAH8465783.1 unnamed protein product [Schistosoma haematobium]